MGSAGTLGNFDERFILEGVSVPTAVYSSRNTDFHDFLEGRSVSTEINISRNLDVRTFSLFSWEAFMYGQKCTF